MAIRTRRANARKSAVRAAVEHVFARQKRAMGLVIRTIGGDYAMQKNSTAAEAAPLFAGEAWFDPIEAELRKRVRGFLEELVEQEASAALGRGRYQRGAAAETAAM